MFVYLKCMYSHCDIWVDDTYCVYSQVRTMAEKITLHLGDEDQNVLGSVVFFLSLFLFFFFFFLFIETSEFFVIVFLSPWSGIHTIMRMWYCQFLFPCTFLSLVNLIPADVRQVFVLFFLWQVKSFTRIRHTSFCMHGSFTERGTSKGE